MSTSLIGLGGYLESVLGTALQKVGSSSHTNSASSTSLAALQSTTDNSQLSPFAQLMSTLQQLQQSNPTQYQQVTQQIATNLQGAAQTATADGNTSAASQLNQLATDFTTASQSGQLPNVQDLAQAVGGAGGASGHHHHHHAHAAASDSDSSSSSSTSSTGSSSSTSATNTLLAAFQSTSASESASFNPLSIIMNTLSTAGIATS